MAHVAHRTARASSTEVCLDEVQPAQQAIVLEVRGGREVARLLAQLHVRAGARLQVRRVAPLGGPLLVECGGTTVIISRRLAEHVRVQVVP